MKIKSICDAMCDLFLYLPFLRHYTITTIIIIPIQLELEGFLVKSNWDTERRDLLVKRITWSTGADTSTLCLLSPH